MRSVDPFPPAPRHSDGSAPLLHLYTLLVLDDCIAAPWAILLEAENDGDAVALARSHYPTKKRELWQRHRLVAEFD